MPISLLKNAIFNLCPACQKSSVYKGVLKVKPKCSKCGFNLKENDAADGPAFFAMSIVGAIVSFAAVILEIKYEPSIWVHIALWPIITLTLSILLLRFFKSLLISMQYKHLKESFNNKDNHGKK